MIQSRYLTLMLVISSSVAGLCFAGDLRAPYDLESTAVLPSGVRNPRFKNIFMSMEEKFSGSGGSEPLGLRLNKTVTWADIKRDQSQTDREKIDVILAKAGITDANGVAGSTTGQINTYADVKIPVLAIGLTERLTAAIAVPVMHVEISTDTGFVKSTQGQQFATTAVQTNEYSGNEVVEKFNDGVNRKVKDYGYSPIQDLNETGIGDIQLITKYLIEQTEDHVYAVKGALVFPTGRAADADKVIDASFGDQQWKLGPAFIADQKLFPQFKLTHSAGYVLALPSSIEKRVPSEQGSSLTRDKEVVDRDFQHQISLGSAASYGIPDLGLTLGGGYNFQYQSGADYSGKKYLPTRYQWLSDQSPSQTLHSAVGSLGFSTVDWYRRGRFVYPFEAKLVYSHPIAGHNSGNNDVFAAELVAFF